MDQGASLPFPTQPCSAHWEKWFKLTLANLGRSRPPTSSTPDYMHWDCHIWSPQD
jgi:hypothetical protein